MFTSSKFAPPAPADAHASAPSKSARHHENFASEPDVFSSAIRRTKFGVILAVRTGQL